MPEARILEVVFPKSRLRTLDGQTELAVAEAATLPGTRPEKVSRILERAFETIGDLPSTRTLVRSLPSGTREWLLQLAARYFHPDTTWFEATCAECSHPYDLSLELGNAARHLPEALAMTVEVVTSLGPRSFATPNGEHEEAFANLSAGFDPRRTFSALCGLSEQADIDAQRFTEHDLELIDEALESVSPDVADESKTICPSCGSETKARIDPVLFAFPSEGRILQDAHLIATAYGWPLDQILALSARHRSFFSSQISRDHRPAQRRLA